MDLIKAGLHNNTSFGAHGMKNWTKKSIDEDSDDDDNIQWYIKTSKGTKRNKKEEKSNIHSSHTHLG